ncbi:MAG: DNA adenine methylase [bacterium]|nr:DNA adenine methylase [bacterium]
MHGFTSPLRYPGGKGMLSNYIKMVLSENRLYDGHYVEVYAGGASIAWSLLFEEYVRVAHINDISVPVYSFWKSVIDHTEELCKLINDTAVTIDEWHRQRAVQNKLQEHSTVEIGFSTFFLNRTNRSGILSGGVTGGKAQEGDWKIDARYNKPDLIARIKRIARYSSRIHVHNLDAAVLIENYLPKLPSNALVFLDPPYYVKGEGLYENHYSHDDHANIALLIAKIKQPWIVSYDCVPQICKLYEDFRSVDYTLSYSAQERYSGREVIFASNNLVMPATDSPATIKLNEVLSIQNYTIDEYSYR